jgi:hypothetical protein
MSSTFGRFSLVSHPFSPTATTQFRWPFGGSRLFITPQGAGDCAAA